MKKIEKLKLTGKLSLNKETVTVFYDEQMYVINGGNGAVQHTKPERSYWQCCAWQSSTSFPTVGGSHNRTCPKPL